MQLFLLFLILECALSKSVNNCQTFKGLVVTIFHHAISVYFTWNFILGVTTPMQHLLLLGVTMVQWKILGRCILTAYHNRMCDAPDDEPFDNIHAQLMGSGGELKEYGLPLLTILLDIYLIQSGKRVLF